MDKHDQNIDSSTAVDETRRRLTKGGLAAPVVLATFSSHNALAGNSVPYKCTISGKLSGNTSQPGTKSCSSLGRSCDQWKQYSWTSIKKGSCYKYSGQRLHTDPNNNSNANLMGACMKDITWSGRKFKAVYSRKKDAWGVWQPVAPTTYNCKHMTLHEVLYLGDDSGANKPWLGREAVAAFLNAVECAPNFPLKPEEVIDMFNATCEGGTYEVKPGVHWDATKVCNYFSCLHT